jgi:hypothetical protein
LPGHLHVAPLGDIAQAHVHTFEEPHTHAAGVVTLVDTDDLVVRAAAESPWLVVYVLMGLALPLIGSALGLSLTQRWPRPVTPVGNHQRMSRPPTPPPTYLLASA